MRQLFWDYGESVSGCLNLPQTWHSEVALSSLRQVETNIYKRNRTQCNATRLISHRMNSADAFHFTHVDGDVKCKFLDNWYYIITDWGTYFTLPAPVITGITIQ